MAIMASSTRSPSAMMRAPSVMRWRSRPAAYITTKTIASTSGTEAGRRLTGFADEEAGRILEAVLDVGDITEPEGPAIDLDRHRRDRGCARERTGDPQVDAIRPGVDRAARHDRVLARDVVENLLRRDPEARELGVAELDEDLFRTRAD